MILCGENEEIIEVPGKTLIEEVLHLMAAHYVCGVEYLNVQTLLYFFQDILMERPDRHGPANSLQNFLSVDFHCTLYIGFNIWNNFNHFVYW